MRNIAYACMRLVIAASFAVSMGLSAATPAAAFTGDQLQHVVDCIGWMFSDPARHAAECGPGHLGNITSDSRGWGYQGTPAPTPPKTCDESSKETSYQLGSIDPWTLLVQVSDCEVCPPTEDFGASYRPGDMSGLLLKVVCPGPLAFRSGELALPELAI